MENELKRTQDNKMYIKRLDKGQPIIMSETDKIIMQNLEVLNELYEEVGRLKSKVDRLGELDVIKDNDIKELKKRIDKLEKSYVPTEEEQLKILDEINAEPKQEKWIVHRTLRTNGMETYVGTEDEKAIGCLLVIENYPVTDNEDYAFKYDIKNAIKVRDKLNQYRVGKQYLWVISKVEE